MKIIFTNIDLKVMNKTKPDVFSIETSWGKSQTFLKVILKFIGFVFIVLLSLGLSGRSKWVWILAFVLFALMNGEKLKFIFINSSIKKTFNN